MGFAPGKGFTREGVSLFLLERVGSTSDFLLGRGGDAFGRLCRWEEWGWKADPPTHHPPLNHPGPGTLAVTCQQSRGRGRQGRTWENWGTLAMSWVMKASRVALAGGLPVWLGLIIALVLRDVFHIKVWLKWPNDLLVDNCKLGGLLLDKVGRGSQDLVVVGLGLNLDGQPGDIPPSLYRRAVSLRMLTDHSIRPGQVAGPVLRRIEKERPRFEAQLWKPFQRELSECDWLRGRSVTLSIGSTRRVGKALGIDDQGALVLLRESGRTERWQAGDVHLAEVSTELDPGARTNAGNYC
jgi:BirA family biotin operon repressor/biotin-[acetyl-CoA-carboxylase] ligase